VAHRSEVNVIIAQQLSQLPARELEARLAEARIAFAGVNTVAEFLDHPVLAGRGRWREVSTDAGGIRALLPPISPGAEPRMDPVPALGQHTAQILAELDRDPQTLEDVRRGARRSEEMR
jgi:itaconate CoA-transferase